MKVTALLAVVIAFSSSALCAAATTVTETLTLSNGTIQGNPRSTNGILSFKGIPYAQAPTGNLRWRSPQPTVRFNGTLNATAYGSDCYANTIPAVPHTVPPSEDCLYINVWTGAQQSTEKRPVMVYVHGGGFEFGSGSQRNYEGTLLATQGPIIVTFNYRLGVFGFLALSELDSEGTNSGNFGLQDQLQAVKWVKNNIAAFGGDPDNITIFGESAGAHSIGLLMSSPLSKGLYQKAILESGAFWDSAAGPLTTFVQARAQGTAFEQELGASSVADLRALPASTINNADPWNQGQDPKFGAFSPSLDKYVVIDNPGTIFQRGNQMKVPLLAGFNGNEGALFSPYAIPHTSAKQFEDGAKDYFGNKVPQPFLSLYPDRTTAQLNQSAMDLVGDMVIREQTYTATDLQQRTVGLSNSVYAYFFNFTSNFTLSPVHTSEVSYIFGNFVPLPPFSQGSPSAQDLAMSATMQKYWTNFARTGNPNGNGPPTWPSYQGNGVNYQLLAKNISTIHYNVSRFQFVSSFRTNEVLPESWRSINVSTIT